MVCRMIAALLTLVLLGGCTVGNIYMYTPEIRENYLITMGESPKPYESRGFLQITAKGANLAGFFPVVKADLEKMFGDLLIQEIEKAGADGIVNVDFKEIQHPTAVKAIFVVLFFIPLPTSVEITGELVKFSDAADPVSTTSVGTHNQVASDACQGFEELNDSGSGGITCL